MPKSDLTRINNENRYQRQLNKMSTFKRARERNPSLTKTEFRKIIKRMRENFPELSQASAFNYS